MHDFEVQRCTRRCAATGRELAPRETIYSKLVAEIPKAGEEGGHAGVREFVRYDYCQSAWRAPVEGEYISWWKWRLPAPGERKVAWAPHEVLLRFFEGLPEQSLKDAASDGEMGAEEIPQLALRYVTALLLVRRRIARIQKQESLPDGAERLTLFAAQTDREYDVLVTEPTPDQAETIQRELMRLLSSSNSSADPNTIPAEASP